LPDTVTEELVSITTVCELAQNQFSLKMCYQ